MTEVRGQSILEKAKDLFEGVTPEDMIYLAEVSSYNHNYYRYDRSLLYAESDDDNFTQWYWVRGWQKQFVPIGGSYCSEGDKIIVDAAYT